MKIFVRAKPGARENKVEKTGENNFLVSIKEIPKEGRANEAIIKTLADYFGVSKSAVFLIKGEKSKIKIFKIKN